MVLADALHAGLLLAVGLVAGFVNTLAGGGALIMVPALMLLGLPADVANATGRVSVVAQSLTGAVTYARADLLARDDFLDLVPATLVGALAGAYVATLVPNRVFEPLLLGTMLLMAAALFLRPETLVPPPGTPPRRARRRPLALLALLAAGFYGGVLQAGAGLIFLALFGGLLHYDLLRGNALKVAVICAYSAIALGVFAIRGLVAWPPGLLLAAGSAVGAHLGVRFAVARGQGAVKKIVAVMVVAICVAVIFVR